MSLPKPRSGAKWLRPSASRRIEGCAHFRSARPVSVNAPMLTTKIETIVEGGGQAGLAISYYLGQLDREHIVLERRRVAERWRSERWDSRCFQAPNGNLRLPGFSHHAADPDAFAPRDDVVRYIEGYASAIRAPMRCGVAATALRQKPGSNRLVIETAAGCFEAKNVVVAT